VFLADCENERVKGTKDEGGTAGLIAFVEEDNRLVLQPINNELFQRIAGSLNGKRAALTFLLKTRRGELDR